MRLNEHVGCEALQKLSGLIEFQDGGITAMENPDVAFRIRLDRDDLAPLNSRRQLRPILDWLIRVRKVVRSLGINPTSQDEDDEKQFHQTRIRHGNSPFWLKPRLTWLSSAWRCANIRPMQSDVTLSVIMPAFNERETVGTVIRRILTEIPLNLELI